MATNSTGLQNRARVAIIIAIIGITWVAAGIWTLDGTRKRLYCNRCAALRNTNTYSVLGVDFAGSDEVRATGLSRWIETHVGGPCSHQWVGYSDGLWYRECHRGNMADKVRILGDDSSLLMALDRRQRVDSGFVGFLVDSLRDRDYESHNFLDSMFFEDFEKQSTTPVSQPAPPWSID